MIQLQRDRGTIPAKYRGPKFSTLQARLLTGYYQHGRRVPFNQDKKFQVWKDAKDALKSESAGKCAYCESATAVTSYGDVEHFRPKDSYWWLAFSYDNYTFSCQLCNQRFKGANFPIAGRGVEPPVALPRRKPAAAKLKQLAGQLCPDPGNDNTQQLLTYFRGEKAHLPHPYVDDPEALFAWQVDEVNREITLVARGRGAAAKRAAKAANDFLGLNREELLRARFATFELIHALCLALQGAADAALRDRITTQLRRAADSTSPYAGMVRHFLRAWNVLE